MKHRTIVCATAIVLLALMAAGNAEAVNTMDVQSALEAGGQRLADLQNDDGGWFWIVGDTDCGYGPGISCRNTFGVTGLGLLASLRASWNTEVADAARLAGDALVDIYEANPAQRPYSQDVEFLAALTRAGFESDYLRVAKLWFVNTMSVYPDAADLVDYRFSRRGAYDYKSLVGWDTASDIRAALATGNRDYAEALALAIVTRQSEWDVDDSCGCRLISMGSLTWAFRSLWRYPEYRQIMEEYGDVLLSSQGMDGSWLDGDLQTTAYIVAGLAGLPHGRAYREAIDHAVEFLLGQQNDAGGFEYSDGTECTEVDSEVLQALEATL